MVSTRSATRKSLVAPEFFSLPNPTRLRTTPRIIHPIMATLAKEETCTHTHGPIEPHSSDTPCPTDQNEHWISDPVPYEDFSRSNSLQPMTEDNTSNGSSTTLSELEDNGLNDASDDDCLDESDDQDSDGDLDLLLVKAQESLKEKASSQPSSRSTLPRFHFPKLESGLEDKAQSMYIQQDGDRARISIDAVSVIEPRSSCSSASFSRMLSGLKPLLEECEISRNANKIHLSKKQKKEIKEQTTGKGWFDMPQQTLTPELKRDLQILKLRNVLDPKRFYKREDKSLPKFPKYFQVGTVIEGQTEFYSSRLSRKERATTITGEVMKDTVGRDYYKRKFDEIQVAKQSGGQRFNKKGRGKHSKGWRAGQ